MRDFDDASSVGSSHSDRSYLSFRTEYSLRSGVSETGASSIQERQENLNRSAMILKKCQEALALKRSGNIHHHHSRHLSVPSAQMQQLPHHEASKAASMAYLQPHQHQYQHPQQQWNPHADPHPHTVARAHVPASSSRSAHPEIRRYASASSTSSAASKYAMPDGVMNPDGNDPLLIRGMGSVRHAQSLLNTIPENQTVVGGHSMVIVYSTRKHAYFAILREKGENGKWKQGVRCTFENVDNLQKVTLIEPAE